MTRAAMTVGGPYLYDMVQKRFIQLYSGLTVGRGSEDPHFKKDTRLSREHLRFDVEPGHAFMEDMGSTNGSKLNGHAVSTRVQIPLADGDLIEAGQQRFYFTMKQDMPDDTQFTNLLKRRMESDKKDLG